ncbi:MULTISPECIES: MFS transporter [Bacillaceae]|uniref:Multidrug transporter n=1 Tax=Alkalicoccobacillus plakortidis TaxID=444060 RepID=A0A9D5DPX8_9BACI|nr:MULTISPECIES: MFS transporter [Bacillaceae]KQL55669.1 multidrug transporter [Alkalicoccobacillus plakortidis]RQW21262.1 MFS transporter [Bacillus sp. C1-1]
MNIITKLFHPYNQTVRSFFLSSLCFNTAMGIFIVMYPFFVRELGYGDQVNGSIIAFQAAATAIALLPAGIIGDRFGRKNMLLIGASMLAVSFFIRSVGSAEWVLVAGAGVTGFFFAFLQVSAIPLLAEHSKEKQRVKLFSLHAALMMAANVFGHLFGGMMTDSLFAWTSLTMLQSIQVTLFSACLVAVVACFPLFKVRESQKINSVQKLASASSYIPKKREWKLIGLFAFSSLLIGFGSGLVIPYLNLYFNDRFHLNYSTIGLVLSLGQAMTVFAMLIGPKVVDRVGEVRAVFLLQMGSIPFLLMTAFTNVIWFAIIGFLFRQALMNAGNPIQAALVMRLIHPQMRGTANSVTQMVFQLGWALMGPVSMGIVALYGAYKGYAIVFCITAALYVIGSIYFLLVFQKKVAEHEQLNTLDTKKQLDL